MIRYSEGEQYWSLPERQTLMREHARFQQALASRNVAKAISELKENLSRLEQ